MKLDNFNEFLNEKKSRKERKADRKLRRAKKKAEKAEELFSKGKDKRAERKAEKAEKIATDAENINPTDTIADDFLKEVEDMKTVDWEDEFDIISKKLGKKVKVKDFEYINKLKIKGDEISPDELKGFLSCVNTYIDQYWEKLENDTKAPREFKSPYNDFEIVVKDKRNRVVFLYKEGQVTDKIKLVIDKKVFNNESNKPKVEEELKSLYHEERLTSNKTDETEGGAVAKNYDEEKDKKVSVEKGKDEISSISKPELKQKKLLSNVMTGLSSLKDGITDIQKNKDVGFIKHSTDMLIDEKLTTAYHNTDEERIINHFVKNNIKASLVGDNIDGIITKYSSRMKNVNEGWDDWENSISRATKSMISSDSDGLVADLMNAFNTDVKTTNRFIREIMSKMGSQWEKNVSNKIETLSESNIISEDTSDMLDYAGYAALAKTGRDALKSRATKKAAEEVAKKGTKEVTKRGIGSLAKNFIKGSTIGRFGMFLANPYVWITVLVLGGAWGSYKLWDSFDTQQYQIARLFIIFYASSSSKFKAEANRLGIKFPNTVDFDSMKNSIDKGETFSKAEYDEDEEIGLNLKSFESYRRTDTDVRKPYTSSDSPSSNDYRKEYDSVMYNMEASDHNGDVVHREEGDQKAIASKVVEYEELGFEVKTNLK